MDGTPHIEGEVSYHVGGFIQPMQEQMLGLGMILNTVSLGAAHLSMDLLQLQIIIHNLGSVGRTLPLASNHQAKRSFSTASIGAFRLLKVLKHA